MVQGASLYGWRDQPIFGVQNLTMQRKVTSLEYWTLYLQHACAANHV